MNVWSFVWLRWDLDYHELSGNGHRTRRLRLRCSQHQETHPWTRECLITTGLRQADYLWEFLGLRGFKWTKVLFLLYNLRLHLNLDLDGEWAPVLSRGMVDGLSRDTRSLNAEECRDWTDGDVLICKWPPEERESFFTGDSFPTRVVEIWKKKH